MHGWWRLGAAMLVLGPAGTAMAADAVPAEAEEIIVTAERRSARVQETPLALSVLAGDALRRGGNQGLTELAQQVPSLSFAQSFGIAQIFIRGVGNNFFSPGGDPGVATYADGVYLSDQKATAVAFLDLARVEVLRALAAEDKRAAARAAGHGMTAPGSGVTGAAPPPPQAAAAATAAPPLPARAAPKPPPIKGMQMAERPAKPARREPPLDPRAALLLLLALLGGAAFQWWQTRRDALLPPALA